MAAGKAVPNKILSAKRAGESGGRVGERTDTANGRDSQKLWYFEHTLTANEEREMRERGGQSLSGNEQTPIVQGEEAD